MMEEEGCEHDWPALQERLAFLLYQFATKVIGERVNVDPLAAENAIRYCWDRAAGGPYIPARHEYFLDFIYRHGGSLEWVMSGDISSLVIGYAAERMRDAKPPPYRGPLYALDDDGPLCA